MLNILKGDSAKDLSKEEVYDFLRAYLNEQIDFSTRVIISDEPFTKLAFSEYIAHHTGCIKTCKKLLDILPDQGKDDN